MAQCYFVAGRLGKPHREQGQEDHMVASAPKGCSPDADGSAARIYA